MKLSVVIPAYNEQICIGQVVLRLAKELELNDIDYEVILVNDNSTDSTLDVLAALTKDNPRVKAVNSIQPRGFGWAIRQGLDSISGDAVVIFMGDGSDDPNDVVRYLNKLKEGYDCVFGSRFIKESKVVGYPWIKFILNRAGNKLIQSLFFLKYNDISNAFKAYRVGVIKAIQPLISQYFNITVEMPLKAIVRGFSYAVIPIHWNGRDSGVSKYHIKELSRKYFFSILFVWLEKMLLKEEIKRHA
ncbi:MAG: glycosyltransferase family 2 protein [Candidatus Omnitrophota bacterium]|nr:glycosyltransferase family 2 protein [Candidatus Omnitrophota bacterium]